MGIMCAYDDFLHLLCSFGFFKILPYWVSLMCYVSAPQSGMGWWDFFCGAGEHPELCDALSAPQRHCTLSIFFLIIYFFHFLFFCNAELTYLSCAPTVFINACVGSLFFTI